MRFLILLVLMFALPAQAQVRKCVDAAGNVAYQDEPCPGKTTGAWVKKRAQSETHGGESAAEIEKRAAAIREANYAADKARIEARARAVGVGNPTPASPGLSPSSHPNSSVGTGCTNCTTPSYSPRTR